MTQIQIINIKRNLTVGYVEVSSKMSFILPAIYGTGANPIQGLNSILTSFPDGFSSEVIPITGTVITYYQTTSLSATVTLANIQTGLQAKYAAIRTQLDGLTLTPYDTAVGQSFDGTVWATTANITDNPINANNQSNLGITITGAAAAAVTLTIPAVSQKFHNIVYLELSAYSTATRIGGITPILVTTTNLSGTPSFTFATAAAVGTTDRQILQLPLPIKSLVSNTTTTIVCPATASIIWRINVFYSLSI